MMRFYLNIIIVLICVSIDMRADGKTDHEYIPFKVYFEMAEAATFKARDMKFSDLPGGVPCAFIYSGPKKPLTHKFFHEMGFRSTVFVGPGESKEKLRALEATGVELALGRYPGAKGNYQSFIGRNTAQEAFDTVAASRIELLSKIKGQLFVASISGHLKSGKWVLQREPYATRTMGFGAVMSDANFRLTYMDKPSVITALLGYKGEDQTSVAYYQQLTSMDTRKIPNEMIYYQILANAFKGATKRVGRGVIVRIQVRDFGKKDLLDIKDQIAEYGSHPNIWHANMGMLLSNQYLQGCIKVLDVKCTGKKGVLTLGIKKDVYGPIIQTPLSLKFPKKVRVTSASAFGMDAKVDSRVSRLANRSYSHVSIAAKKAFHEGLSFEWSFKKKTLTTPDQTEFEVVVRSQLKHALSNIKLHWYAPTGVPIGKKDQHTIIYGKGTVVSGKANKTTLAPGGTLTIKGTLQTHKHSRFGLTPVSLNIEGQLGKTRRLFLNGAEIPVMPLLGVEMHPRKQMPMRKGDVQYFRVKVSNENAFLHPNSASANKGVLRLTPFEGLAIEPKSISFQLKKNESKYFIFKVTNSIWSDQIIRLRPEITLAGSKTPISNLAVGTRIVREQKLIDIKPLD
ncbi:MAG: hypothetical protein MJH11_13925, partial [Lentisphaeria bacterium]|nr:hypothetical protein [Lentisphaeria bacterium]